MSDAWWTLIVLLFSHGAFTFVGFVLGSKLYKTFGVKHFSHKEDRRPL